MYGLGCFQKVERLSNSVSDSIAGRHFVENERGKKHKMKTIAQREYYEFLYDPGIFLYRLHNEWGTIFPNSGGI